MNITIHIENPNVAVLKALALAAEQSGDESSDYKSFDDLFDIFKGLVDTPTDDVPGQEATPVADTPADEAVPAATAAARRITYSRLSDLHVGDPVRWEGGRFRFDGVVDRLDRGSDKVVHLRPHANAMKLIDGVWSHADMTKPVSLTEDDLDNHMLVKLAA